MRFHELISELTSRQVHSKIDRAFWQKRGQGSVGSVWQHYDDPNTVVKVLGGDPREATAGVPVDPEARKVALAFVHFLVDHGHESKHFPIVHGINVDHNEILQIRLERLQKLPGEAGDVLNDLAYNIERHREVDQYVRDVIEGVFLEEGLARYNSIEELTHAVKLLIKYIPQYARFHNIERMVMDLHCDNWMMRADGTIVAVDPWN